MAEKNNIYTKRPLMVMILNGGGIRGYASLCILEEVEKKCKEFLGSEYTDEFKPCTVFNVIGGVSTGAIIAIMLGRLEMTIAECKREYERFSEIIFGDTKIKTYLRLAFTLIHRKNHILPYLYKADGLEQAIDKCLQERGFGVDEPLSPAEDAEIGNQCTVMVPVIDVGTLREYRKLQGVNRVLCTHTNDGSSQAWTIKQAIMAATSAPIYFPSPYEHPGTKLNFLDAATTGNSNPSVLIYSRIKKVVGHRKEALLLDIGTGRSDHPVFDPLKQFRNIPKMCAWMVGALINDRNTEERAKLLCDGTPQRTYHRLDVVYPSKSKPIQIYHHQRLAEIEGYVKDHFQDPKSNNDINNVAELIASVLKRKYENVGTLKERHERLCDPCNKASPDNSDVCFFNPKDEKFFRSCVSSHFLPYTSAHLPTHFGKFVTASNLINACDDSDHYPPGQFDRSRIIKSAIEDFGSVLRAQSTELDSSEARNDRTIRCEIALTLFKLSIAYGIDEQDDERHKMQAHIKRIIVLLEAGQSQSLELELPCAWFSTQGTNKQF